MSIYNIISNNIIYILSLQLNFKTRKSKLVVFRKFKDENKNILITRWKKSKCQSIKIKC